VIQLSRKVPRPLRCPFLLNLCPSARNTSRALFDGAHMKTSRPAQCRREPVHWPRKSSRSRHRQSVRSSGHGPNESGYGIPLLGIEAG